jgi:polar amino acid transport system permease protein
MSFDWEYFGNHLLRPNSVYVTALWTTLYLALISQTLGTLLGAVIAGGRLSPFRILRTAAFVYTWLIRGVPVIVFMVLFFTGLAAARIYRFEDIDILGFEIDANIQAAIVALSIREAAYMSEVIRNGLQSVEEGQISAARALGMPRWMVMRRVVIPQAMRVIIPPLGNNFNIMLKTTSLASVIGVQELFLTTRSVSSTSFRVFEMFLVLALNYLILTTAWAVIQVLIEMRLRRHEADADMLPWWRRLLISLGGNADDSQARGMA